MFSDILKGIYFDAAYKFITILKELKISLASKSDFNDTIIKNQFAY
jgi:hypothetical protein